MSEWLNDKKNQPIIIGGFVAVMLVLGVLYLTVFRGGGSSDSTAPAMAPGPMAPGAGVPGGGGPSPMPAPGGAPTPPPLATPDTTGGASPGAAEAAAPPPGEKQPPLEEFKGDPFQPFVGPKPPRTKPTFMARLPKPDIRRVAPVVLRPEEQEAYIQPPQGRMAGMLKNDRVFAIIESEGRTTIVKPGDQYPFNPDFSVDRILPDRVVLRTTKTQQPRFFELPKSAGNIVSQPGTSRTPAGPMGPAGPGRARGPGRFSEGPPEVMPQP